MALQPAVVAHDGDTFGLHLVHGAVLGDMSELRTVATLGLATGNWITGIFKSSQDLVVVLGPAILLRLTTGLVGKAVVDGILLAKVALQVHVGQGDGQIGPEQGDQVQTVLLRTKGLLKFNESNGRLSLEVDLNLLLNLVDVALLDGRLQKLPGVLSGHVGQAATINLAGVLALGSGVLCCEKDGQSDRGRMSVGQRIEGLNLPVSPQLLQVGT